MDPSFLDLSELVVVECAKAARYMFVLCAAKSPQNRCPFIRKMRSFAWHAFQCAFSLPAHGCYLKVASSVLLLCALQLTAVTQEEVGSNNSITMLIFGKKAGTLDPPFGPHVYLYLTISLLGQGLCIPSFSPSCWIGCPSCGVWFPFSFPLDAQGLCSFGVSLLLLFISFVSVAWSMLWLELVSLVFILVLLSIGGVGLAACPQNVGVISIFPEVFVALVWDGVSAFWRSRHLFSYLLVPVSA